MIKLMQPSSFLDGVLTNVILMSLLSVRFDFVINCINHFVVAIFEIFEPISDQELARLRALISVDYNYTLATITF